MQSEFHFLDFSWLADFVWLLISGICLIHVADGLILLVSEIWLADFVDYP